MHKHEFNAKAFRRLRLPVLFLAMAPSFLIDAYLAYGIAAHVSGFLLPPVINSFWDAAAPFAANFVLLKATLMLRYSRVRLMRLGSFVRVDENQVVYRKSKLHPFSKINSGYAYHDDYYFKDMTAVRRKPSGGIAVEGAITAVRRQHGIEAVLREWTRRRMTLPGYYEDMNGIEEKLKALMK